MLSIQMQWQVRRNQTYQITRHPSPALTVRATRTSTPTVWTVKAIYATNVKPRGLHKEHRIFPRTHREAVKARRKAKQLRKKHTNNEYVRFCKKCNEPCCIDCIANEHALHAPFINIDDAAKDAMADIQSYMAIYTGETRASIYREGG